MYIAEVFLITTCIYRPPLPLSMCLSLCLCLWLTKGNFFNIKQPAERRWTWRPSFSYKVKRLIGEIVQYASVGSYNCMFRCLVFFVNTLVWYVLFLCASKHWSLPPFSCSLCAGAGCDGVPEQYPGGPWPSSRPALLLHHQRCPQQPQHHLDGDTTVQCQPARAGTVYITSAPIQSQRQSIPFALIKGVLQNIFLIFGSQKTEFWNPIRFLSTVMIVLL